VTLLRALAIATAFASLAAAASPQDVGPRVAAVADLLGCSGADREHLVNGEVVACRSKGRRSRESGRDRDRVTRLDDARDAARRLNHADRRVLATGFRPRRSTAAFAALPIGVRCRGRGISPPSWPCARRRTGKGVEVGAAIHHVMAGGPVRIVAVAARDRIACAAELGVFAAA
jgi:hypothetical protein